MSESQEILAIGFNLTKADKDRVASLFQASGLDAWPYLCVDARSTNNLAGTTATVAIIFGDKAANLLKDQLVQQGVYTVSFPPVKNLHPPEEGGIKEDRIKAFETAKSLVESLKSGQVKTSEDQALRKTLKPADLADLSIQTIQALEKALKDTGKDEWSFLTRDGKVVAVTLKPGVSVKNPDIQVTLSELLLIRAAMDVFKTTEVHIAPAKKP